MSSSPHTAAAFASARGDAAVVHVDVALRVALAHAFASRESSAVPRLALALSGGLDSMVLLDALAQWTQSRRDAGEPVAQPLAIHIHHGLSGHADEWLATCEREARLRGFAFEARRVNVPRDARQGIEGAARAARYTALAECCAAHGIDWLLTAHHANDQAETVLLQMLRGAGLPGVAAMAVAGVLPVASSAQLLRPLLDVSRETMQTFATVRSLSWVEDPSNQDRQYLRNALRHDVMPAIAAHVPAYRETLARFARHAAQAQSLLDQLAQMDFDAAHVDASRLQRRRLQGLDTARLANLLRYWAAREGLAAPPEARLDEWVRQIRDAQPDASLTLPHGDAVLRLYRDVLQWTPVYAAADADAAVDDVVLRWSGERVWPLPQWQGSVVFDPVVDADAATQTAGIAEAALRAHPLIARERAGGERWRERPDGHSRSLKHWYQNKGVPAWQRHVPIVWQAADIVFVPRLGIDGAALCVDGPRWRMTWRDEA
ncbi:tRNA lysidine(34) synthetase TilS [Pandoraea sp. PE-S2T-3]|uniref:tRNA lysidine(34) synthetase TilS n=1 Tax=Pandoraea sp. PE-S2T-3 TaxID=1986993 RepID=UPI00159634C2|nr:tRNA lysidine(34) synthetase TilS [Pandoraea sp. PE-S2T-3]